MTEPWSMPPGRGRRGRRLAVGIALVAVFGLSLVAGWSVTTGAPGADGRSAAASRPTTDASSPGASAPGAGSPASAAPATPASSPTPSPSPTPTPTPSPSPTPPPVAPALVGRLDRALAAAQKSLGLPGVEATVTFADGSSWTGVRGLADVKTGRKVTPETPFAAASVTKTFTSALILRYVDQGRIGLDDRLSRWLPTWPNAGAITIRMLLNHTSGIPDYLQSAKFDAVLNLHKGQTWTPQAALDAYEPPGAVFPPGKGWDYSNSNYALLGLVAEQVGGAPWSTLVRSELLDPLGLAATYVQGDEQPTVPPARAYQIIAGNKGPTPLARTDGSDVVPFTSVVTAAGSAGAIASTTADLAQWARALYAGDVLTAATRRQLLTFVKAYSYGTITSYGLGVSRVTFQGRIAYGHNGALAGTRAGIRYFPADGVAVAVAFNCDSFVGDDVVRILARALFPTAPTPSPGASPRPSASP